MWPILLSGLLAVAPVAEPGRGPLLVSAAISLTEAMEECGEAFTARTGIPVRFNFGPSNALARQIAQGAPVDVFVSADQAQMAFAVDSGAVASESVSTVATNRLVIIEPGRRRPRWKDAAPLVSSTVRRVAAGDPRAVPAGVYAREWLERIGLWSEVAPKLVPATSVRGALSAVRTGAVDAGIVYVTDAQSLGDGSIVFEVNGSDAPRIEYPAGVVTSSPRLGQARAFIQFLRGPVAQQILQRRGFGAPATLR
jgi:molybdate transport system substrate-binding protein